MTHPLVGLLASLQTSVEQMWIVAAIAAIGGATRLAGGPQSLVALLIGAGAAQTILIVRWLTTRDAVQETCLKLIIRGHHGRQIRALERERRRLAEPRHQVDLATRITNLIDDAEQSPKGSLARPVFSSRVVRTVTPELRGIAERLMAAAPSGQGVALMEWLLRNGVSPLYGTEVEPLRRELRRARYLLDDGGA